MQSYDTTSIQSKGRAVEESEKNRGREEECGQGTGGTEIETPPKTRVFIYSLEDEHGNVRYVGKTTDMKRRYIHHFYVSRKCRKENWIKSLLARGQEPIMELLEEVECSCDEDWYVVEEFWISYLRFLGCDLTNIDRGGKGKNRLSAETRAKMSAARKGRKGLPMTPEHKAKLIASHAGKPWPEKSKEKLRATMKATNAIQRIHNAPRPEHAWNKGIAHRMETRAKMSETHKARGTGKAPKSPEHREKIRLALMGRKLSEEERAKLRGPRGPNIRTRRRLQAANEQNLFITHTISSSTTLSDGRLASNVACAITRASLASNL